MSLSVIDREILERCLSSAPRAWENFVDRFLGLMVHVVNHTTRSRNLTLSREEREDLVAEVFAVIVADKYGVLRRFERNSSLATYLSVIARRVVIRKLSHRPPTPVGGSESLNGHGGIDPDLARFEDAEEIEQLLRWLPSDEAKIVKMYHLDGLSYREISDQAGINESSIGPVLTRAREKMRRAYPGSPR
ncbi:MAG: sigma-70 family RNA polymerase sigma factor [Planctomycetaceae bacterium]|nr:MAG: sigma-70 family RNA polymerase sigma factor [Planctomycetaceae bacterium]